MAATQVASSAASVLASLASTPSKIHDAIMMPASIAARRETKPSAVQYVSNTAPIAPSSDGMRYAPMDTSARRTPISFAAFTTTDCSQYIPTGFL